MNARVVALVLGVLTAFTSGAFVASPGTDYDCGTASSRRVPEYQFSGVDATMASVHNLRLGFLQNAADQIGTSVKTMAAVLKAESGNKGYREDNDFLMTLRFEAHVFYDEFATDSAKQAQFSQHFSGTSNSAANRYRTDPSGSFEVYHGNQAKEYEAWYLAQEMDERAGIWSASYGAPQVMGFNYQKLGFESPRAMAEAFDESIVGQLQGMVDFILGTPGALSAIRVDDYPRFARFYNGAEQPYGGIITEAVASYEKIKDYHECSSGDTLGICKPAGECSGEGGNEGCDADGFRCCLEPDVSYNPSGPACSFGGFEGTCQHELACTSGLVAEGLCEGGAEVKCCVLSCDLAADDESQGLSPIVKSFLWVGFALLILGGALAAGGLYIQRQQERAFFASGTMAGGNNSNKYYSDLEEPSLVTSKKSGGSLRKASGTSGTSKSSSRSKKSKASKSSKGSRSSKASKSKKRHHSSSGGGSKRKGSGTSGGSRRSGGKRRGSSGSNRDKGSSAGMTQASELTRH